MASDTHGPWNGGGLSPVLVHDQRDCHVAPVNRNTLGIQFRGEGQGTYTWSDNQYRLSNQLAASLAVRILRLVGGSLDPQTVEELRGIVESKSS